MDQDLDDLMRKPKRYWYEDGLVEILGGLFFLTIGLLVWLDSATPQDAVYKGVFAPGYVVVTFAWVILGRRVIGFLKERVTYPRTGWVVYPQQRGSRLVRVVLFAAVGVCLALALAAAMLYRQDIVRVAPIILGAGTALLLVRIAREAAVTRFHVLALWCALCGLAIAWLTDDLGLSMALFYALMGMGLLATGLITLLRYVRLPPVEGSGE